METISITTERCGKFNVFIQGILPKNAPVILTVPDMGCDHSYYEHFVNTFIPGRFCWCHIELPGQSFGASEWTLAGEASTGTDGDSATEPAGDTGVRKPESTTKGSTYPTMQELAVGVKTILEKMEISQAVLFAEGSGANLLSRVAILCDERILGAMLIHGRCTQSGPLKLLRDRMRNWKSNNLEPATEKYLLEHRFGTVNTTGMSESLKAEFLRYKRGLHDQVNAKNLNLLTYTYAHRTSLADMIHGLKCPVLFITGTLSTHRSGVRHMFEVMNKARKSDPKSLIGLELMEIDNTAAPLIEKPEKVAESAMLFFQGLGIVTSAKLISAGNTRKSSIDPTASPASPERRSCTEFVNLDSISSLAADSTKPPVSSASPNSGELTAESPTSSRFLNRQLSMAELDLPRGPDALSTLKLLQSTGSAHSSRKYSHGSTVERRLADTVE